MKAQKTRGYTEYEVLESLKKKHDIKIVGNGLLAILYGSSCKGDIGIKTKGKIDFLTRYKGWKKIFVTKFD